MKRLGRMRMRPSFFTDASIMLWMSGGNATEPSARLLARVHERRREFVKPARRALDLKFTGLTQNLGQL